VKPIPPRIRELAKQYRGQYVVWRITMAGRGVWDEDLQKLCDEPWEYDRIVFSVNLWERVKQLNNPGKKYGNKEEIVVDAKPLVVCETQEECIELTKQPCVVARDLKVSCTSLTKFADDHWAGVRPFYDYMRPATTKELQ
jgi:hypothetical protein